MKQLTNKVIVGFLLAILAVGTTSNIHAQDDKFRDQALRYGFNLGWNFNSASLGYQQLHGSDISFNKPNGDGRDKVNGKGNGFYGGVFIEYLSESWWGIQLRGSYEQRNAVVKDIDAAPNTEFDTKMSYLSFEPALRIDQHLIPGLSFTAGPLVAANIHGTYDYKPDVNGPVTETNIKVPDRPVASLGLTAGLAYDFELSRNGNRSFYLSPFFDYSWIAGQRKSVITRLQNSSVDIWSTQTFRLGMRLSWESRNTVEQKITEAPLPPPPPKAVPAPVGKMVSVVMPHDNTITTKNIKGYFPLHPFVFFEKGSQDIPSRYIVLSNNNAQKFSESDLEYFTKGGLTEKEMNVNQLMKTYYNVMNIFADRMRKNPDAQLTLNCFDPDGKNDRVCASKIKNYLVNNFGIDAGRIKISSGPLKKPSGSSLTDPSFHDLINDENRRVVFNFSNEDMYKPVSYTIIDESSSDNDMMFSIRDDVQFKNWTVSVTGENRNMNFGPFTSRKERINPAPIMRGLDAGKYNAKVAISMMDGTENTEDIEFSLRKNKDIKVASRYLMIFDYDKYDPLPVYAAKIRREITPGINTGNMVIIHGHTDIIGNEAGNQTLSQNRADQAKRIIDDELGKENKAATVQAAGDGQTIVEYTFDNQYPEGRMYNRNAFIAINQ